MAQIYGAAVKTVMWQETENVIGDHPGRWEAGLRGANLCRGMGMVASGGVLGPTAGPDPLPC
jgi:hypothetical protein